jgi:uncharacterized membrane protein YGL010W
MILLRKLEAFFLGAGFWTELHLVATRRIGIPTLTLSGTCMYFRVKLSGNRAGLQMD